jgi:hypothetical protein
MKKRLWYLSGAISGDENYKRKFSEAAQLLKALGFRVYNPVKQNEKGDKDWTYYMKKDIKALLKCGGLMRLPDWKESRGARLEYTIANELGLCIMDYTKVLEIIRDE